MHGPRWSITNRSGTATPCCGALDFERLFDVLKPGITEVWDPDDLIGSVGQFLYQL
jgi:hypothetical protein